MILKPEQFNKFIELHKNFNSFMCYSDDQKKEIANGIANYYLTLFNIQQRIKKDALVKSA